MEAIMNLLVSIANWLWGYPILIIVGGGGLYISVRLGFIQFRKIGYICSQTFGKMFAKNEGGISSFKAACTALAASVGASNIVGVPVAIAIGGPGSIFWMWVLALVGMATKYTEIALAVKYREKNQAGEWSGGPAYYIRALGGGHPLAKGLAISFTFCLLIVGVPSLSSQAVSAAVQFETFGIDTKIIGVIIAIITAIVCYGGIKRIADIMNLMVPFMAVIYVIGALIVVFMNADQILPCLGMIVTYAFKPMAAVGGFTGSTVALAIRWGAARGIYSNEAGYGTAPIAHCTAEVDHPIRQAAWSIFEIAIDTLVVCTLTALAVLTTGVWKVEGIEAGSLAQAAFRTVFGAGSDYFVAVCVFLFVLSTMIVCVFYGQRQAEVLVGPRFGKVWIGILCVSMALACFGFELTYLLMLTDFFVGLCVVQNMIALVGLVPEVSRLQNEYYNTPGKYYLADMETKKRKKRAKAQE